MTTSSCSSRYVKGFFAAALVLQPFGPVPELLKEKNPWNGFRDDAPVLTVLRAHKVLLGDAPEAGCARWVDALAADSVGKDLGAATAESWSDATGVWEPWKKEELQDFAECDGNPCAMKLSDAEVARLAAVQPGERQKRFLSVVLERVQAYQKTQERKEYEFKGDPVDPWKHFEKVGLKAGVEMPKKVSLEVRKIDFFPGRVKTLHQVLDTRVARAADGKGATLWRRDAYTDHYFDSWGEWAQVSCDGGSVTVVMAMLVELDLMKKTDLLSRMMRGKMRGATEDNGAVYLARWFERVKKRAGK